MVSLETIKQLENYFCDQSTGSATNGKHALKVIEGYLNNTTMSKKAASDIWKNPQVTIGDFKLLSYQLKRSIQASCEFYDQEYVLENMTLLRKILFPSWWIGNFLLTIGMRIQQKSYRIYDNKFCYLFARYSSKAMYHFGTLLTKGSLRFAKKLIEKIRFTAFYKQPLLYSLWKYLKVDIASISSLYAENMNIVPSLGPVWKKHFSSSTSLIGIDFIPSQGKLFFLEANFNPGLSPQRFSLYPPGVDPIFEQLVLYAKNKSYSDIWIYGYNININLSPTVECCWRQIADKFNITLKIIDDLFSGSNFNRDKDIFIRHERKIIGSRVSNTLHVLIRSPYNTPLINLVAVKGRIEDLIRASQSSDNDCPNVFLPNTYEKNSIPRNRNIPFPNIIVKHKTLDQGAGITILSTTSIPKKYRSHDYLINEFVIPDVITEKGFSYVQKYRSLILLTVEGPIYLGSYAIRSNTPIPQTISEGVIKNISPYIANQSMGGQYRLIANKYREICLSASLSVGGVIYNHLKQKFFLQAK